MTRNQANHEIDYQEFYRMFDPERDGRYESYRARAIEELLKYSRRQLEEDKFIGRRIVYNCILAHYINLMG